MIGVVDETLGLNIHDHVINGSLIHKCRIKLHMKIAEKFKTQFYGILPSFVVEHWGGKLFSEKLII